MSRRLITVALGVLALVGCGGRTGLGVWPEGENGDAGVRDGAFLDAAPDALRDGGTPDDRGGRQDAGTGKNCAQVMLCVFDSLQGGFDWQSVVACSEGATLDGLSQAGSLVLCLARKCGRLLIADGGGQFDILVCLLQNCHDEICACEGIEAIVPPGILVCP